MEDLVNPSEIPWDELKADTLEEMIFWLMDSMGAKDLEWRKGGKGITTSDGGRDIETSFHVPTPDDEIEKERWWIEVKKRNKTLEKSSVQNAVINASNNSEIDVLVVATNSTFSNPTRDWVKEWQRSNKNFRIKLWDRESLERMLIRHPSVIIRIWRQALTTQGRLEALTGEFWNKSLLISPVELNNFWLNRHELEWDSNNCISVFVSEYANGKLSNNRWLSAFETEYLVDILIAYILNLPSMIFKAISIGLDQKIFFKPLSFLLIKLIIEDKREVVFKVIKDLFETELQDKETFEFYLKYALLPVFQFLGSDLLDVCKSDCSRITSLDDGHSEKEAKSYWHKFLPIDQNDDNSQPNKEILTIELFEIDCTIGLKLDKENHCPILHLSEIEPGEDLDSILKSTQEQLASFELIINHRFKK